MTAYHDMTPGEQENHLREAQDMTEVIQEHRPTRASEAGCWDLLAKRGWDIQNRGWPDFLCSGMTDDFKILTFCVEVKRHPEDFPREHQLNIMRTLEQAGIPCFLWDRHTGFKRVGSNWDGELGKQPEDVEFTDPGILRCVFCGGGGRRWSKNPETPKEDITFEICEPCNGTGLAVARLAAV